MCVVLSEVARWFFSGKVEHIASAGSSQCN